MAPPSSAISAAMTFSCIATGVRKELDPVLQRVEQEVGPVGQQVAGVGGAGIEGETQDGRQGGEQHQAERQRERHRQRQAGARDPERHGQSAQQAGRTVMPVGTPLATKRRRRAGACQTLNRKWQTSPSWIT